MTKPLTAGWRMSAAAVGTLAELGGALLTPPAQICATVAARCCPILLPVCLDAVFASLTPEQRSQLATTITTDLAAAAAHHQPAPETPPSRKRRRPSPTSTSPSS